MPTKRSATRRKNPARKVLGRAVPSDRAKARSFVDSRKSIWYVGRAANRELSVFKSSKKPTESSHGHRFTSVTGPMTKAEAEQHKTFTYGYRSGR